MYKVVKEKIMEKLSFETLDVKKTFVVVNSYTPFC